jgi:hypothetical protein
MNVRLAHVTDCGTVEGGACTCTNRKRVAEVASMHGWVPVKSAAPRRRDAYRRSGVWLTVGFGADGAMTFAEGRSVTDHIVFLTRDLGTALEYLAR